MRSSGKPRAEAFLLCLQRFYSCPEPQACALLFRLHNLTCKRTAVFMLLMVQHLSQNSCKRCFTWCVRAPAAHIAALPPARCASEVRARTVHNVHNVQCFHQYHILRWMPSDPQCSVGFKVSRLPCCQTLRYVLLFVLPPPTVACFSRQASGTSALFRCCHGPCTGRSRELQLHHSFTWTATPRDAAAPQSVLSDLSGAATRCVTSPAALACPAQQGAALHAGGRCARARTNARR